MAGNNVKTPRNTDEWDYIVCYEPLRMGEWGWKKKRFFALFFFNRP